MEPTGKFGRFVEKAVSPEAMAYGWLPLAGLAEVVATQGKSKGDLALSLQDKTIQGIEDREARDAAERERIEAERQKAFARQLRERYGETLPEEDQALYGAFPEQYGQRAVAARFATSEAEDSSEPGYIMRSREWDTISAMPEGPEKEQAKQNYLYRWTPGTGYRSSPESISQDVRRQKALTPGKIQEQVAGKIAEQNIPPKPVKLETGQVSELAGTTSAIEMLDTMVKAVPNINLTWTPVDKARAFNPWDPEAQAFNQLVASTKQVIGKGLEGGVLRKEDEYKYDKIIPKLGDTKEVLKRKAEQLRGMLVNKYDNTVLANARAGRDVSEFPEIPTMDYGFITTPAAPASDKVTPTTQRPPNLTDQEWQELQELERELMGMGY